MSSSKQIVNNTIVLSEMRTWQSGILQSAAHRNIKRLTDTYLQQYGLTTMHWFILGAILDGGIKGVRITDLADRVGTTLSYLTTAINSLELRGMVTRVDHETDNRTKLLSISPGFLEMCVAIEEGMRELLRHELYPKISREELTTYISVLQKLSTI